MASGDENESLGYAGYMWEPEYSEEELFERLSDTDDGGDIGHARSADPTWCTCNFAHRCQASKKVPWIGLFFFFGFFFVFALCPINSYGHFGMASLFPGQALTSA